MVAGRLLSVAGILLTGATFSTDCFKMLNREQCPEECDATGFHSSNAAGYIKKYILNTVFINKTRPLQTLSHSFQLSNCCSRISRFKNRTSGNQYIGTCM